MGLECLDFSNKQRGANVIALVVQRSILASAGSGFGVQRGCVERRVLLHHW